jgi:integrase
MPVSQVQYKRKNGKARYDPAKKAYIGYRIDVVIKGKRHRDGGFATRKDAEYFIDRLKAEARDRRHGLITGHAPTLNQLLTKRLGQIRHERIRVLAARVFAAFQTVVPDDPRITEIRSTHFQQYVNSRKVSSASIRRELAELSTAFRSAAEMFPELEDYVPPVIKRPRRAKLPTKHVITEAEKDAIVSHLQDSPYKVKIARMFELSWFLGLRYGEIVTLKKADFKRDTLTAIRWKTNDVIEFKELPERVREILEAAVADAQDELLFPTSQIYPNSFYAEFGKAVRAAGLIYGRGKLNSVVFHSARHSFVTRASQHADLKTVASMSGHSDASMVMHYTHATDESRRELMRKMYNNGTDLRAIYDKVRAKKMTFTEFEKAVK